MANTKYDILVKIAKIGEKGNGFWIKDEKGDFYSGFKEYQGKPNLEYEQLMGGNHDTPFKEGDMAVLRIVKKAGVDKDGKDKIFNNIVGVFPGDTTASAGLRKPVDAVQAQTYEKAETPEKPMESRENFGRRLAIHGMVNGLLAAGMAITQIEERLGELLRLENSINKILLGNLDTSDQDMVDGIPF